MNFLRFGDPARYSLHPFGKAVVIHCTPCGRLTPEGETFISGQHWATVDELDEALAWMQWHELASHPTAAPDPHEGVPAHHHHFDGPACTTPDDGHARPLRGDPALYGVLLGHGRDATLWAYNDEHAANIIGRRLGGAVLALPIMADYRVYDSPADPVAALEKQREAFGPCPTAHPTRGDCLGFAGHKPPRHMNDRGVEWDDDLHTITPERPDVPDELKRSVERAAGIIGQALSGALGVPVMVVDEETGTETEYGPHSPAQPAGEQLVDEHQAADKPYTAMDWIDEQAAHIAGDDE